MKYLKLFLLLTIQLFLITTTCIYFSNQAQAQPTTTAKPKKKLIIKSKPRKKPVERTFDDMGFAGMPEGEFPAAPYQELALTAVNLNMDYVGLNSGQNELHIDQQTGITLWARANTAQYYYYLFATDKQGKEVPITTEISKEKRGCLFVVVDKMWVNTLCSQKFKYDYKLKGEYADLLTADNSKGTVNDKNRTFLLPKAIPVPVLAPPPVPQTEPGLPTPPSSMPMPPATITPLGNPK